MASVINDGTQVVRVHGRPKYSAFDESMATELKTSKHPDGSGFGQMIINGQQAVAIYWQGRNGATPSDVIRLTITRMEDEQRGGPFADPKAAKALALMLQADRELRGDQTSVDGVPIIGD
jgi:hypothetical protein